ncbi:pyridoxamine 5'-phosphate oxidase family protein [Frankia sp. Cr2]|uniref:pyridoxamine 5'-phosphate oxidase family protein n=1 Tax=Frankia sp. Cr2 TaxID=3073932 RepID=UPI002AD2DFC2|nr:pyridoxamine 5'-phosphate oxidase family protein [Frankia sp. Cr2]
MLTGSMVGMANWDDVETAAPELAAAVRGRFEAYGLAILATLRRDGSPRVSGIEPLFALGGLWLGMMPDSRKGTDLLRDPRCALHNATTDKNVAHGDAKINGRAVVVSDTDSLNAYRAAWATSADAPVPEPFALFRIDVTELTMISVADDELVVDFWREGARPGRTIRK